MKNRKYLLWVLIVLFAGVAVFSAWQLIRYFSQVHQSERQYAQLAQLVEQAHPTQPSQDPSSAHPEVTTPTEPALVEVTGPEGQPLLILPEYQPVYQLNNDLAGWICIDGTDINYPVLYKPDHQDYYLNRDFYGDWSNQGAIYIQENCDPFRPSDNLVIYGHRMQAGTMFAQLHRYKDRAFWEAHPYIQLDCITEHRTYQILAAFSIDSTPGSDFLYHQFTDAADPAEFDSFLESCRRYALYDTGITAQPGDQLITLSTCDGESGGVGRFVVVAKRIPE